ncbi:CRISPR-associated helicase Cas3' [Apilactobacillus timberlakei]|uniref:CRISPR-associated helicase Cas3' n=1 Tax=Apilactobacillus timberlakei TaxID=2008380 RepID=UPI0011267B2E|nr:CRISPR-associated helicase Cas3' [Apilactobacillus timberlakei]TPR13216.1 CRISPR-associated helicase Cas3' [Apilactobacillus timberlakei]
MNITDILWAKKSKSENGMQKWLPLKQHLLDTKGVMLMLYRHYLSDHQKNIIKESIDGDSLDAEKLVEFLGASHDIGKATPVFQAKSGYQGTQILDEKINYNLLSSDLFSKDFFEKGLFQKDLKYYLKSPHALAGEALLENFGVNSEIGSIIGGHHGKPIKEAEEPSINNIVDFPENYYFNESKIYFDKWDELQKEIFYWTLNISGYNDANDLPNIEYVSSQVILEGLLIMGDWIASCDDYFPLFDLEQKDLITSSSRLENGFKKWFKTSIWTPEIHNNSLEYYKNRFDFKPREFQKKIFESIKKTEHPGIVIIESGMGSGKTEAALSTVEQLAQKMHCDGMFYCLPTQATTNAMFSRVISWLSGLAIDDDENKSINLIHGKSSLNENFANLPHNIDIDDEDKDAGVLVNDWFAGKKTKILDDFVVGTIDQLLLLALKKKHLALRHLGFSGKVVVIDEAHGFDSYMQTYLCRALEWLGKYKIPVIILSATLPAEKRIEFINSYLDKDDKTLDNKIKNNLSYPLVSYSDDNKINVIDSFTNNKKDMKIKVINFRGDILKELKTLLSDGGICGIIVNTVIKAQKLAKLLMSQFGSENVEILHASFLANERIKKEKKLVDNIGNNSESERYNHRFRIIIGTQVLEQSLDIDFDVLFSDIAPMDLLLQRAGRLHRHKENDVLRPSKLVEPKLYVLGISEEYEYEDGSSFIYGDYLLMRTQYYLEDIIHLPHEISKLIQTVYDFTKIPKFSVNVQKKYLEAKDIFKENKKSQQNAADAYRISSYEDMEDNLIGWLDNSLDSKDKFSDEQGLAQVRNGNDNIEVIMVKAFGNNGYSIIGDNYDISKDVKDGDPKAIGQLVKNTIKIPQVLSQKYNIENTIDLLESYNMKKLPEWQSNPWLKGALGIVLNENNRFPFDIYNYTIKYDKKIGLTYNKEEQNGQI